MPYGMKDTYLCFLHALELSHEYASALRPYHCTNQVRVKVHSVYTPASLPKESYH